MHALATGHWQVGPAIRWRAEFAAIWAVCEWMTSFDKTSLKRSLTRSPMLMMVFSRSSATCHYGLRIYSTTAEPSEERPSNKSPGNQSRHPMVPSIFLLLFPISQGPFSTCPHPHPPSPPPVHTSNSFLVSSKSFK